MEEKVLKISGFIGFAQMYVNDLKLKLCAQIDSYAFAKESLLFRYRDSFGDQFAGVEMIISILERETDIKEIFPEP